MEENLVEAALSKLKSVKSGEMICLKEYFKGQNETDYEKICKRLYEIANEEGIYLEEIGYKEMPFAGAAIVKRKVKDPFYCKENCTSIYYKAGGYMSCLPNIESNIFKRNVPKEAWEEITNSIFDSAKVLDWFDSYIDHGILDGDYWELRLRFKNHKVLRFFGSNASPESLSKVEQTVLPYNSAFGYI